MSNDWRLFRGENKPRADQIEFPKPPPWREFDKLSSHRGATFQANDREIQMVNAALYLRRPLLITGPPGSGKSSLIYAVAAELGLGDVLRWPISSRSTLVEGLYRYDALARLRDVNEQRQQHVRDGAPDNASPQLGEGRYITLGPLGTALLPRPAGARPRALLIDEIDKSDIDLPNDLLDVFEEGRYEIPELVRLAQQEPSVGVRIHEARPGDKLAEIQGGRVRADAFPFVVITSNQERELPPAFLRRCLRLDVPNPDKERLEQIVRAHLGKVDGANVRDLIERFLDDTKQGRTLARDQLLNAIFLVANSRVSDSKDDWEQVREALMRALE